MDAGKAYKGLRKWERDEEHMCGICCILCVRCSRNVEDVAVCSVGSIERAALHQAVRRRGPDAFVSLQFDASSGVKVEATSSVLRLRGDVLSESGDTGREAAPQPAMVTSKNHIQKKCSHPYSDGCPSCPSFLQWNGEVFGGSLPVPPGTSDTTAVLLKLHQLERECAAGLPSDSGGHFFSALTAAQTLFSELCVRFFENDVEGPYAFVYYADSLQLFLFGRDPLGRRSLLIHVAMTASMKEENKSEDSTLQGASLEVVISSVPGEHFNRSCLRENSTRRCNKRERCEGGGSHGGSENNEDTTSVTRPCVFSSFCCCWDELPNSGLFAISAAPFSGGRLISHYPWAFPHSTHPLMRFQFRSQRQQQQQLAGEEEKEEVETDNECSEIPWHLLREAGALPSPLFQNYKYFDMQMTKRYFQALWKAVEVRVRADNCGGDPTRPVGVLFSGGIDCTVLAAIAHYVLPSTTPIELINVAFGDVPELAPDRVSAFRALGQLLQLPKPWKENKYESSAINREWRLLLVDVPNGAEVSHIKRLVHPGHSAIDMSIGTALWHAAQGHGRMQRIYASDEVTSKLSAEASLPNRHKLYRLFIDSSASPSVLEALIPTDNHAEDETKFDPLLEAIISELEAFGEAPTSPVLLSTLGKDHATTLRPVLKKYGYKKLGSYLHDASTAGVIAFAKRDEAPSKAIRLVRPVDLARVQRMTPAKWLTCEGQSSPLGSCVEDYTSEARVLLLGMGADETLGGYTRHRRAFERRGIQGLVEELGCDFSRLWKRNLGRDDRVVCDSGREGRYPYLDEGLLNTLEGIVADTYRRLTTNTSSDGGAATALKGDAALEQALAPVCCFTAEDGLLGVGDKKILRRCAAMLGLGDVVRLQKRAIQFGSRVAYTQC